LRKKENLYVLKWTKAKYMVISLGSKTRILGIIFVVVGIVTLVIVYGVPWSAILGMTAWWSVQYYFIIPGSLGVLLLALGVILLCMSK